MSREKEFEVAYQAYQNAFAKYSHFKVGAVAVLKNGELIPGVNVENASYGLTNCAERTALFATYAKGYRADDIDHLIIVAKADNTVYPCGACRQVIMELMNHESDVILCHVDECQKAMNGEKNDEKMKIVKVKDLMPGYFGEEYVNGQKL